MQQLFQFIILTFVYSSTCFGRFPAHHQELNDCSGSLWFYLCIVVTVVLCSWSGRPAGRQAYLKGCMDSGDKNSCSVDINTRRRCLVISHFCPCTPNIRPAFPNSLFRGGTPKIIFCNPRKPYL